MEKERALSTQRFLLPRLCWSESEVGLESGLKPGANRESTSRTVDAHGAGLIADSPPLIPS